MNIGIYVRVSTAEQVEGYSIGEQIERLSKYAEAHGWTIAKVYNDAGFSGGNLNRPALQDLIHDIDSLDGVLVYKLDRLSRSQKDTLYLIEDVFMQHGVSFVSMSENLDTSSPFGKAMIGILAVFAQLEREQIKERMSIGREGRAKEGLWRGGGIIPIGYEYENGKLVVNEFEAVQIREIFRLYASGHSLRDIRDIMDAKGYATKYGKWRVSRIGQILENPLYVGKVTFSHEEYDGVHEAIVSPDLFEKCVQKKAIHKMNGTKRSSSLLGGLLFCKKCGARYAFWRASKGYGYYSCYSRRKIQKEMITDPGCKNKNYRSEKLESMVLGEIAKFAAAPVKEVNRRDTSKPIRDEIKKIDRQRMRILDLYAVGSYSIEELQKKLDPLMERKAKLTAQLEAPRTSREEAVKAFKSYRDVVERGTQEDLRILVHTLIDKIEIDGDDLYIHWAF